MICSLLRLNNYLLFTSHLALKETANDLDKIYLKKQEFRKLGTENQKWDQMEKRMRQQNADIGSMLRAVGVRGAVGTLRHLTT